jgi:hypothetical protein
VRLWLLLHFLGFTMWLGASIAVMCASIAAKVESRQGLAAVVRAQAAVQRLIIGPGALLTVLSGLMLTLNASSRFGDPLTVGPWLMVMQVAGVAAGLLTLFVVIPTGARVARLDPEVHAAAFDHLRKRLRVVASISGVLGLLALVAGAFL